MYYDLLLRYHLNIDPASLSDEQWVQHIAILKDIRQKEMLSSSRK